LVVDVDLFAADGVGHALGALDGLLGKNLPGSNGRAAQPGRFHVRNQAVDHEI